MRRVRRRCWHLDRRGCPPANQLLAEGLQGEGDWSRCCVANSPGFGYRPI